MEKVFAWLYEEKEWLFSGIGVTVIIGVITFFFKKTRSSHTQKIKTGDHSTSYQAGGDMSINTLKKDDVGQD